MFSNFFFPENRALYKVEKYRRDGRATDDNMPHACCIVDT